jgi:hypothetical protein
MKQKILKWWVYQKGFLETIKNCDIYKNLETFSQKFIDKLINEKKNKDCIVDKGNEFSYLIQYFKKLPKHFLYFDVSLEKKNSKY